MHKAKSVEAYVETHPTWSEELKTIRALLLKTEFEETLKWGMPTYTINGKNVIGLAGFKNHFCIWFHQGAFLSDPDKVLVNAQEGKTKAMRHMRFTSSKEINKRRITAYAKEAIANQKAGKEIKPERKELTKKLDLPDLLSTVFKKNKSLAKTFKSLTLSQQNAYIEFLTSAKREDTKQRRLKKILPLIEQGLGLSKAW